MRGRPKTRKAQDIVKAYHPIWIIHEKETYRGVTRISVADWVSDQTVRILEKRTITTTPSGYVFTGKTRGFNYEDFQIIMVNKDKILELLRKGPNEYPVEFPPKDGQ